MRLRRADARDMILVIGFRGDLPTILGQPGRLDGPVATEASTSVSDQAANATQRLRIAVLLDHLNAFSGGYEAQLRDAIHTKCRESGHHLLFVYGGPAEAPRPP